MQINSYVSDRQKKRKRRRAYFFTAIGLVALYLIFFIVQWFIFHSPIFRVDKITVVGNTTVSSADVITLVEASALSDHPIFPAIFSFKNMFLWPSSIPTKELQLIPQLDEVSITKDYFGHSVTIKVTERAPIGIWCFSARPAALLASSSTPAISAVADGSCYWFDKTGTLFEKSLDTQGNIIFVVYDSAQKARGLNETVLPQEFLPNFISIMDTLRQANLPIKAIDLSDLSLEEVDVLTANGPTIYFSLRFPADDDLPVIQKLMVQSTFNKLNYIDCRTENRVYYK